MAPKPAPTAPPVSEGDAPPEDVADAAEQARDEAQRDARAQASRDGVTLSDAQLDRIGTRAAEATFQFFEREGAFRQAEPPPPPPPPDEREEQLDDTPRRKRSWASNICDR